MFAFVFVFVFVCVFVFVLTADDVEKATAGVTNAPERWKERARMERICNGFILKGLSTRE